MSRVNLKLKFRKGNYHPGCYDVGRLMDFVLRSTGKAMGDHGIEWGGKTLLDLDYTDD